MAFHSPTTPSLSGELYSAFMGSVLAPSPLLFPATSLQKVGNLNPFNNLCGAQGTEVRCSFIQAPRSHMFLMKVTPRSLCNVPTEYLWDLMGLHRATGPSSRALWLAHSSWYSCTSCSLCNFSVISRCSEQRFLFVTISWKKTIKCQHRA